MVVIKFYKNKQYYEGYGKHGPLLQENVYLF